MLVALGALLAIRAIVVHRSSVLIPCHLVLETGVMIACASENWSVVTGAQENHSKQNFGPKSPGMINPFSWESLDIHLPAAEAKLGPVSEVVTWFVVNVWI